MLHVCENWDLVYTTFRYMIISSEQFSFAVTWTIYVHWKRETEYALHQVRISPLALKLILRVHRHDYHVPFIYGFI